MDTIRILHHHEPGFGWSFESPDIPGLTGGRRRLRPGARRGRRQVRAGVRRRRAGQPGAHRSPLRALRASRRCRRSVATTLLRAVKRHPPARNELLALEKTHPGVATACFAPVARGRMRRVSVDGEFDTAIAAVEARLRELDSAREACDSRAGRAPRPERAGDLRRRGRGWS